MIGVPPTGGPPMTSPQPCLHLFVSLFFLLNSFIHCLNRFNLFVLLFYILL